MVELISDYCANETRLSASSLHKSLSISRSTYYRSSTDVEAVDDDIGLRDIIQQIALEMPSYGYRRITKEMHRRGIKPNHKRVLRLMRQDNLLILRKKKFVVTTDSGHGLPVYPNLTKDLTLDGINQLWVSDITYIRLRREFVYLAVILDGYSRCCVGWRLGRRLDDRLTLGALKMALEKREVRCGLVHHSDRGVQYASREYTDLLKEKGLAISMSRTGNPYDNAMAESFMKTLKYEEVYLSEYDDMADAYESIGYFIEGVYNLKRLHSSIGYMPPAEFEQRFEEEKLVTIP